MIKVHGSSESPPASRVRKKSGASAPFKPGAAQQGKSAAPTGETAPAAMMSALIALQSDSGGAAKTLAAAQRTLDMLDRLQMRLLDGRASPADLDALSAAASARAHAGADQALLDIYDEIALRARVELAKLGR